MDTSEHSDRPGHPTLSATDDTPQSSAAPADTHNAPGGRRPLSWPPPGLGRVRGDAYLAARWLAAGSVLILPLLTALVLQDDPWTLGIGDGFWVAAVLGLAGLPVLGGGYTALKRLLDRAREAAGGGYGWRLIALAACDQRGDTGFLIQGERVYSVLSPRERRALTAARLLTGGLFLGAAVWLSLGFGIAVILAARGLLSPAGLAGFTLGPTLAAAAGGLVLYAWEETVLRRARKEWHAKPWSAELQETQIRAWKAALARRSAGPGVADQETARPGAFRVAGIAATVAMVTAFVSIFLLVFASTVAPIVAMIAVPRSATTQAKVASLEPLRHLALEPDPSISAVEAGEIVHLLAFVGDETEPEALVRPPVRRYAEPVLPPPPASVEASHNGIVVPWLLDLLERPDAPLEPAELDYLNAVASHPAHAELARLARAGALDAATARWRTPLPTDRSLWMLPLPRLNALRATAYAHVGKAALEARSGDPEAAETTLREVLSAGLLLSDHGTTLLENLVGSVLAGLGAQGLERLWMGTGRTAEAESLARHRAAAERTVERAMAATPEPRLRTLQGFPAITTDSLAVRGLRWETFALLNAASPCINPHRIVFGPDPDYEQWVERVRASLVRSPAEAELFDVARQGGYGRPSLEGAGLFTRIVTLTMGGVDRDGSCGRTLATIIEGG